MPTEETQRYCPSCERNVLARRKGTNHVLHLLLSIITVGLWLPIWLLASVRMGGWRCASCGSTTRTPRGGGSLAWLGIAVLIGIVVVVVSINQDDSRNRRGHNGSPGSTRRGAEAAKSSAGNTTYRLISVEEISVALARRYRARIEITRGRTREELEATLKRAAREICAKRNADAVIVFAYRPGDDTHGVYSVGRAEYAPNGVWADEANPRKRDSPKDFAIDIGAVYFFDESTLHEPGTVVYLRVKSESLRRGAPNLVSVSKEHDEWGEETVIARVRRGTSATILERRSTVITSDDLFTRYRVSVRHDTTIVQGWVHHSDVRGPDEAEESNEDVAAPDHSIRIEAKVTGASKLEVTIHTDIPLPVEMMASVTLKGLAPGDLYVGAQRRVRVDRTGQTIALDGTNEKLPTGEYEVEVSFYPLWGAKKGNPKASQIPAPIVGTASVRLRGTGESADAASAKKKAQLWVMENLWTGVKWNEQEVAQKLGAAEQIGKATRFRRIYYYPRSDITLIVNPYKGEITTWRIGRASK